VGQLRMFLRKWYEAEGCCSYNAGNFRGQLSGQSGERPSTHRRLKILKAAHTVQCI